MGKGMHYLMTAIFVGAEHVTHNLRSITFSDEGSTLILKTVVLSSVQ